MPTGPAALRQATDSALTAPEQPLAGAWRALWFRTDCTLRIGNHLDVKVAVAHPLPEAVGPGTAERHWDELLPSPRELPPRLRLLCPARGGTWPNPSPEIRQAVHAAFAGGRPEVRGWCSDDEVVGLMING